MIRQRKKSKTLNRRNPQLYSRTESVRPEKKKGGFLKLVVFTLIVAFLYLFFFSSVFRVATVNYIGDENKKESVLRVALTEDDSFWEKNILLYDTESKREKILEDKTIEEAIIKKDYTKKNINIEVKVKAPKIVLVTRLNKYFIDENGNIFKAVGEGEGGLENLIKINYKLEDTFEIGQRFLPENQFQFIKDISLNFEQKVLNKITSIDFENSINEITVFTDGNFKIYFDTKRDFMSQLNGVQAVKKEAEKKKKRLDYVDLRVESRVFYTFK